jgi:prepilin-type N-terminal cleavage/methylation domain-containing protein
MKQRGFTIVELLVVITVMAILLTLAVVNLSATQVQARDSERRMDVENIATALESFYNSFDGDQTNTYPSTVAALTASSAANKVLRENTGDGSLHAPGIDTNSAWSFVVATNSIQTTAGVLPAPTTATYVYQPLSQNASAVSLCTDSAGIGCTKFNIFYRLEKPTDECPAPSNICVLRSKRQ